MYGARRPSDRASGRSACCLGIGVCEPSRNSHKPAGTGVENEIVHWYKSESLNWHFGHPLAWYRCVSHTTGPTTGYTQRADVCTEKCGRHFSRSREGGVDIILEELVQSDPRWYASDTPRVDCAAPDRTNTILPFLAIFGLDARPRGGGEFARDARWSKPRSVLVMSSASRDIQAAVAAWW